MNPVLLGLNAWSLTLMLSSTWTWNSLYFVLTLMQCKVYKTLVCLHASTWEAPWRVFEGGKEDLPLGDLHLYGDRLTLLVTISQFQTMPVKKFPGAPNWAGRCAKLQQANFKCAKLHQNILSLKSPFWIFMLKSWLWMSINICIWKWHDVRL